MQDLLWQLKDVDAFSVYVSIAFAGVVFWFIREIVGAPSLATFSVPILVLGGVVAPLLFRSQMIMLSYDKEANVAATTAVGVFASLLLVMTAKWLWTLLKERQVRNTKLVAIERAPRVRR